MKILKTMKNESSLLLRYAFHRCCGSSGIYITLTGYTYTRNKSDKTETVPVMIQVQQLG